MRTTLLVAALALFTANVASAQLPACPSGTTLRGTFNGTLVAADPDQTGRLFRDGVPDVCPGTPPTSTIAGTYNYDIYNFTNASASSQCITVVFDAMTCTGTNFLFVGTYSPSFNPANILQNVLGDIGGSPNPTASYGVTVPANAAFQVVVSEVTAGAGCVGYQFGVCSAAPIPVELTRFDATVSGRDVVLEWETASETNNAGFEVQVRSQAENGWRVLGFVEGHGTTTEANTYSYVASGLAPGTHVFRLRQVDYDGTTAMLPEVEVTLEVAGTHLLSNAYPNPFNPQARFELAVARTQEVEIGVYDALGRQVATLFNGTMEANQNHAFTFEANNLPSGLYVIRAVGETFSDARSVTLLR
ncbi:MAG TPA: T9SS type A sorting domain-containing protein [Rubricoccaceae bacterium]|nr:T9SS type A sorting domain-containing protein [Rubricoccaceae bacterium]